MTPYDTGVAPDPFTCSTGRFESLTALLSGNQAAGWTHAELEEELDHRGRELPRQLMQDYLDLRAVRKEEQARRAEAKAVGADGCLRPYPEYAHARHLACQFGLVRVRRVAFRQKGLHHVYVTDAQLVLPAGRHSMGLRRLAVLEAVRGSFDQAAAAVERRCGPVLGKRQLEQRVHAAAADIDDFYREKKIPLPSTAEMLLVLQADGKGVVMGPEALRPETLKAHLAKKNTPRTRLAPGEKPHRKRMATLACVFDATRPRAARTMCSPRPRDAAASAHRVPGRRSPTSG